MRTLKFGFLALSTAVATACALSTAPLWSWHTPDLQSLGVTEVLEMQNGNVLHAFEQHWLDRFYFNEFDTHGTLQRSVSADGFINANLQGFAEKDGYVYGEREGAALDLQRLNLADGTTETILLPLPFADDSSFNLSYLKTVGSSVWASGIVTRDVNGVATSHLLLWRIDGVIAELVHVLDDVRGVDIFTEVFADGSVILPVKYSNAYVAATGFSQGIMRIDMEGKLQLVSQIKTGDALVKATDTGFYTLKGPENNLIEYATWSGDASQVWQFSVAFQNGPPQLLAHAGDKITVKNFSRLYGASTSAGQTWSKILYEKTVVDPVYNYTETSNTGNSLWLGEGKAMVRRERFTVRPAGVLIGEFAKITATHTELYEVYDIDGNLIKTFSDAPYERVVDAPGCHNFDCGSEQSPDSAGICFSWYASPLADNRFAVSNVHCTGDFSGANPGVSVFKY